MSTKGKITYTPFVLNNITIHHNTGEYDVIIQPTLPSFRNMRIRWDHLPSIPATVADMTFGELISNPVTSSSVFSTSIMISGQQAGVANGPYTDVTVSDGTISLTPRFVTFPPASLIPPGVYDNTYNINSFAPNFGVMTSMSVDNHSKDILYSYDASSFTITIVIDIDLVISCTGSQLDTPTCVSVCQGGSRACLQNYANYCFPSRIGTDVVCQDYFRDFLENNGPDSIVDTGLSSYCTKYSGFKDLFESNNQTDIDLCACHMGKQQYTNYTNELFKEHPELSAIPGIIDLCLVPDCLNSPYPAVPIPKGGCKTPSCVVIGEFNNDGTFTNSTIKENVSGCGGPGSDAGLSLAMIALFIVVIIIVVVVIVLLVLKRGGEGDTYDDGDDNGSSDFSPQYTEASGSDTSS